MMHTTNALYGELVQALNQINLQIASITKQSEDRINLSPYPELHTVHSTLRADGRPVLLEMLAAKAQTLSAMAALKAADVQSKAPGPKGPGRSWG